MIREIKESHLSDEELIEVNIRSLELALQTNNNLTCHLELAKDYRDFILNKPKEKINNVQFNLF